MGFDQYHEPPEELSQETRTYARVLQSLIEEAEAISWYAQRLAVEKDEEARAVKLLADPQRVKRFSTQALKKAKTFDANQLGKQMLSVYEQSIQDKKDNQYVTLSLEETASQQTASAV